MWVGQILFGTKGQKFSENFCPRTILWHDKNLCGIAMRVVDNVELIKKTNL